MSGPPHRMWKDFDKIFDTNCIGREEGSWELVIIFSKNVYCSTPKLLTELRILQIWFIHGAQITLDVRQCAEVQFSAEVSFRWGFQSSFTTCKLGVPKWVVKRGYILTAIYWTYNYGCC